MSYIRKATARQCLVHIAVLRECMHRLTTTGYFEKGAVLRKVKLAAMEDSVRWDFISAFVEEDTGVELVAMAPRFFKAQPGDKAPGKDDAEAVRSRPQRFIAGGHGKRTAGYAAGDLADGIFTTKRIEAQRASAKTLTRQANRSEAWLEDRNGQAALDAMEA